MVASQRVRARRSLNSRAARGQRTGARRRACHEAGWAKGEVRPQSSHTALLGSFAVVAAFAALGAITIGLITLYFRLSVQLGPFPALGIIGSGLLILALILIAIVLAWKRPCLASRPRLHIAQPATLIGRLTWSNDARAIAGREDTLKLLTDTVRHPAGDIVRCASHWRRRGNGLRAVGCNHGR